MEDDKRTQRQKAFRLFGIIAAAIAFYFLLLRWDSVSGVISTIMTALEPLVTGVALAYILRPASLKLESLLRKIPFLKKGIAARAIAVALSLLCALLVITAFCLMVIPQLIESVKGLIAVVPGQVSSLLRQLEDYMQTNEAAATYITQTVSSIQEFLTSWVQTNMLGTATALIGNAVSVATGIVNLFLSFCVAVYVLLGWERYIAQCKKLFLAVSTRESVNAQIFDTLKNTNRIFGGYIVGKLLDCLIVGIICFVAMTLLGLPYSLLISVIVAVTNIIPMFGPFIGAVIGGFLVLLVSPIQCLIFIAFILILQQLDGNIIGPRVLGDSTGISALYVTIGILLFGKLFGFAGMVLGVPLFASLYDLIKRFAESRLKKRRQSTHTEDYMSK